MIAFPRTTVPVPDAVADLSASQLPPHIRQAVTDAGDAGRLLTETTGPQYAEARQLLHQRLAQANRVLAAHNPHRMYGWGNLPGLQRKER
ncbi:hypothetical protein ACIRJM_22925 [Streptomyces sp. NPDC102405]|uniref:hypothetical protein n=1 Tax=Streptomyces sp. NPDC102405 TaxID=3366170 RepID=UPI003819BA3E